ncbi:UMP-CMP kinase [Apostasia shenzhenica]|uniref:UMP-CMP kinase n=1 Tax=Apostasia shenzhenica TaxID=1088818 RepID=A0A2I0A3J0_9ASPA|nr:UMP-CMP kinase [Apostasia shenzhenica]
MGGRVDAPSSANINKDAYGSICNGKVFKIVFVLGGPGSGKGTQCANIVRHFGFTHLSAGDLLRAESKSGSETGIMIENMLREGMIVPSEVTVKLLLQAMLESGNDKILIDGFPRNEENRVAFENIAKVEPEFVLFLDCPQDELERRLLNRNQGRDDDNIETIRKRFKVFIESTLPVIEFYTMKGKVRKIDASKSVGEVFEDVKVVFSQFEVEEATFEKPKMNRIVGFELMMCLIKRLIRDAERKWRSILSGMAYTCYLLYICAREFVEIYSEAL